VQLLRVTGEVRSVAQKHIDRPRVKGACYRLVEQYGRAGLKLSSRAGNGPPTRRSESAVTTPAEI
jgi:hypothetical protein